MPDITEVKEMVLKEMKAIGAESKENYNLLRTELQQLRTKYDSALDADKEDSLLKQEVKKLGQAVSVRQEASDKKMQERMDAFEVSLRRPGGAIGAVSQEELKSIHEWQMTGLALSHKLSIHGLDYKDVNVQAYQDYAKAYNIFLRTEEKALPNVHPDAYKFLQVGVDPDGGYRVPITTSSRITQKVFETSPIRALCAVETISTGAMEFGTDLNEGVLGGWVAERTTPTATGTPQLGKRRIVVHEQYAEPAITQTMLEDAGFNVEGWLANKIADKMARVENTAFVTGDGRDKPRGFLTYPDGTDVSNSIEQVPMLNATKLIPTSFTRVKYAMVEDFLERGTWLMNRTTVRDVMEMKTGDGQFIWRPGLQPGQPSTILNLPLRMATDMPAVAANALSVALAFWPEAYLVVDRLGITVMRDPYTNKPFVLYYTRKRVGGDVTNFQAIKIGKVSVS